eukprot:6213787-Pleurochrysis_carterae.AAC.4
MAKRAERAAAGGALSGDTSKVQQRWLANKFAEGGDDGGGKEGVGASLAANAASGVLYAQRRQTRALGRESSLTQGVNGAGGLVAPSRQQDRQQLLCPRVARSGERRRHGLVWTIVRVWRAGEGGPSNLPNAPRAYIRREADCRASVTFGRYALPQAGRSAVPLPPLLLEDLLPSTAVQLCSAELGKLLCPGCYSALERDPLQRGGCCGARRTVAVL